MKNFRDAFQSFSLQNFEIKSLGFDEQNANLNFEINFTGIVEGGNQTQNFSGEGKMELVYLYDFWCVEKIATNPITGTLSTSDGNISIVSGETENFVSSSYEYSIEANQTLSPQFSFMIEIPDSLPPYTAKFELEIIDSKNYNTWYYEFEATFK